MPDVVLQAARSGDVPAVGRELDQFSEADRRRLAPKALKLMREVREAYVGRVRERPWPYTGDVESVLHATQTLVLGVATPAELSKVGAWGLPPVEIAVETLKRRPALAEALVDSIADMLHARWSSHFAVMRSLVRDGVIPAPGNQGYVLAMIHGLAKPNDSVLDALRADPGLLEHEVWRLFEVEGAGETSLAAHDKYTPEASGWSRALVTLSGEGRISRARLLDASLAALARDFAAFRAGWFAQFNELLAPTPGERSEREAAYVALLASPVPATVSFAVRALVVAGQLSDANVDRLAPALTSKAAATVKGAIRLLPRSERGAVIAAGALPHATRDGQVALLAFIEATRGGERVSQLVAEAEPALAPSLRREPASQSEPRRTAVPVSSAAEPLTPMPLPGPVRTIEDLMELLARMLEGIEDAHDVERALDGASRLCDRSDRTIRHLEPVSRRAQKMLSSGQARPFAGESPRADIAGLVTAWTTGQAPVLPPFRESRFRFLGNRTRPRRSVLGFLSYRALEIAARAARGKPAPILGLPTDRGGAIDPMALDSRRSEMARLGVTPGEADALQAALRAGEIRPTRNVRFDFGSTSSSHTYQGKTYKHTHFELQTDPPLKEPPALSDVPGLFVAAITAFGAGAEADYCATGLAEAVRWVGTVWPNNREVFYAKGAAELGRNVDWWQAMWHVRSFLEPLLLPNEPIKQMGCLLLSLGLAAKEPGEKSLATDVLIRAVEQRRLDPRALGETLGQLYDYGVIKGSRIASTLSDAGRVSDEHTEAVAIAIERLLASMHGPPPPDLHTVLTALSDSLAARGRPLSDPDASAYLAGIEGTGKAAVLAKQLLATGR